jgi:omega-6 fatty acid desaturase (delta-12 desaturase)
MQTLTTTVRREGRELFKATKEFARDDRAASWWHLWSTIAILAGLLTLTVLALPWPVRVVSSLFASLVLIRLFIIYHDHQHGTILLGSRLAKVVMAVYGILTLNPPSAWRFSHNHHHKNNLKHFSPNVGSYPIMTVDDYAKASCFQRFQYALSRHPMTMLLGYVTVFLYSMSLKSLWMDPRTHFDCAIALVLHVGIIIGLALLAPSVLLLTFLLPMAIAASIGAYLFYSQHNFPDAKFRPGDDWDYFYAALNSSSFTAMSPVMHWFTGNIGYHHVHHLNARIPFYKLPLAMARIPELQSPGTISLSPRDIRRCLKLKLWDPRKNRLVSFKGE